LIFSFFSLQNSNELWRLGGPAPPSSLCKGELIDVNYYQLTQ